MMQHDAMGRLTLTGHEEPKIFQADSKSNSQQDKLRSTLLHICFFFFFLVLFFFLVSLSGEADESENDKISNRMNECLNE